MDSYKFDLVIRKQDPSDTSGKTYKKVTPLARTGKGTLWAGTHGRLGIKLKNVVSAGDITAKNVVVQVFEVSAFRKAHLWLKGIKVAEFNAKLKKEGGKPYFAITTPIKNGTLYTYKLPSHKPWIHWFQKKKTLNTGPWNQVEIPFTTGYKKDWKPDWLPIYFQIDFNTGMNKYEQLATIVLPRKIEPKTVLKRQNKHLVRYPYYSIGIKIFVDGSEVYQSRALYLDFHNILSHNLRIAAEGMLDAHYETLHKNQGTSSVGKGDKPKTPTHVDCKDTPLPTTEPFSDKVGTHYGNEYPFYLVKFRNGKIVSGGGKQSRYVYKHCKKHKLQHISCMGYPIEAGHLAYLNTFGEQGRIRKGYRAANKFWRSYRRKMPKKKATFGYIAEALIKAGWNVVYFNPNTTDTHAKGFHKLTAKNATKGFYRSSKRLRVHDLLVDYKRTGALDAEQKRKLKAQLKKLKNLEFSFLITQGKNNDGDSFAHVAMVIKDYVYEVHYTRSPTQWCVFDRDKKLEDWGWGSGILIVPPGQWIIKNPP